MGEKSQLKSLMKAENISFYYDNEKVLNNVNFELHVGEFVILTGENGAAKSTFIKNLLGLLTPASGHVDIASYNELGDKLTIGYVPQTITAFNAGFPSTVQTFVESGRYPKGRWFKRLDARDYEFVNRALDSVNMTHMRHQMIGDLSGGQKQRIILARVFATDPDVFILDEPTTGMDVESREGFYKLLRHLSQAHNKAILMVTHADEEMKGYYDREVRLVREEGTPWRCFSMTSSNEHF